jgi:hypothetical protein
MQAHDVRLNIVQRLEEDLIGPLKLNEELRGKRIKPSDIYLSGILWPLGEKMGAEDDDAQLGFGDEENDEASSSATLVGQQRPCSMGISFATFSSNSNDAIKVSIKFATYKPNQEEDSEGNLTRVWKRQQYEFNLDINLTLNPYKDFPKTLESEFLKAKIELHLRTLSAGKNLLTTVTLVNRSHSEEFDAELMEELSIFQTEIRVTPLRDTKIVPKPHSVFVNDEDDKSNKLLYRKIHDFASGHQCSVDWIEEQDSALEVSSTWVPKSFVPAFKEDGDEVFSEMALNNSFDAESLSLMSDEELFLRLNQLTIAYDKWIDKQNSEALILENDFRITAEEHIKNCKLVNERMKAGVLAITKNKNLAESFRLANAAMSIQHKWKKDSNGKSLKPLAWRPFQLGFILLAAESTCINKNKDREILDLLWFPTGGGKTEAYLAIVGMLSWYRRLSHQNSDDGDGNAAVMRYTLRLLTAQQFERASSLILACELLRKGKIQPRLNKKIIGETPFSIGLWVGKDATPNTFKEAILSQGKKDGSTAEQIEECPCCHGRINWNYHEDSEKVNPFCINDECLLGKEFGYWPVFTVDQDIYRERPTLLIGTVDKFAQLALKEDISKLFGFGTDKSTDLIIQDELHLISGPLGTITGLYETAFDWLLQKDGIKPKVIGSTATIRRAQEQVKALFDRKSCQFPPQGINYDNSGFAVVDYGNKSRWRMYVGLTTAGRSAKFALQATAGSVLQSGSSYTGFPDNSRDGYSTLLCYFNSLKELGGAIVQMLDDVPDAISLYSRSRNEERREILDPKELTSRVSQRQIIEILGELKRTNLDPDCVDVVLATNMVSVGVDVPRLGLMVVNGQPKTRSEYIQSTSRVGRSSFPGLVVSVLNAAKPRDRSHYETFPAWHQAIYRDVEATSVTPFASRSRDRGLPAILVSMIRHTDPNMASSSNFDNANTDLLRKIIKEIERRVASIDPRESEETVKELNELLNNWFDRNPTVYLNQFQPEKSLLQYAEDYAKKIAAGRLPGSAWPVMNTMRSLEPSSRFRMKEYLNFKKNNNENLDEEVIPRWRQKDA